MPLVSSDPRAFPSPLLPHAAGLYYGSQLGVGGLTTVAHTLNTLFGCPFFVPVITTYTSIVCEVTTLSAGNLRMGIYRDSTSAPGTPGALVLDAGVVSTGTTGAKSITISQSLDPGWYWLASVSDASATLRAYTAANSLHWLGFTSATDTNVHIGRSVAFTYAALPDPFTGGSALVTGNFPRVMLSP